MWSTHHGLTAARTNSNIFLEGLLVFKGLFKWVGKPKKSISVLANWNPTLFPARGHIHFEFDCMFWFFDSYNVYITNFNQPLRVWPLDFIFYFLWANASGFVFRKHLEKTCFFSVICVFFSKNSPLSSNQKEWKKKEHPCEHIWHSCH